MILFLSIGFLAGVVTSLSPCVLPVLPVVLSAGATRVGDSLRRPLAIVLGLVTSFGFFTLFAGSILSVLGLPQDFLRNAALVLLGLVAVGMLVPQVGYWIERPFARLATGPRTGARSGFVLGLGL
ncbi:MAG: cytochrome c biogenesis protein CcdA, partial [Acidimicrobiales bacterium]